MVVRDRRRTVKDQTIAGARVQHELVYLRQLNVQRYTQGV